jgi:hypothetical protein
MHFELSGDVATSTADLARIMQISNLATLKRVHEVLALGLLDHMCFLDSL